MRSHASLCCILTLLDAPGAGDPIPHHNRRIILYGALTAQRGAPPPVAAPTLESGWSRVYIADRLVRDAVVKSLDGAAEWLKTPTCQSLLSEFADGRRRPLNPWLR